MIKKILDRINTLPPFPVTVNKVMQILQSDDYAVRDVVEVIKRDPAVATNILKICNSAYFGPHKPIKSISDAVVFLGQKQLSKAMQTASAARYYKKGKRVYGADAVDLWEHSVAVAIMSQILMRQIHDREDENLYTAALVHDIGKLVMGEFVEEETDQIFRLVSQGYSFLEAEEKVLGINHADLGGKIAEYWHFPRELCQAIAFHHRPDLLSEEEATDLPYLVYLSDQYTLMMGIDGGMDGLAHRGIGSVLERFHLKEVNLERSLVQLYDELNRARELMEMQR
ncbi:MAG: HDOD domain-containing protein [Syntrophales bacterium]|nr:HDOD domain-containing protein [Syntrophales bacterium]